MTKTLSKSASKSQSGKTGGSTTSKSSKIGSSVKSFTGTATGNNINVGQAYATSRGTVVAQSDGTFRNVATGQVSRGSSEAVAEATTFRGGGSDGGAQTGYVGGKQTVKVGFAGPGTSGAATGGKAQPQSGPGAAKVASTGAFFSNVTKNIETQLLYWGGKQMNTRKDISDGGDFEQRWGEWGGAIAGLAVMGADVGNMAASEIDRQKAVLEAGGNAVGDKLNDPVTGKPRNMSDQTWLQTKLDQYAANERVTRLHEVGLGTIIGYPGQPGSIFDVGSWWK